MLSENEEKYESLNPSNKSSQYDKSLRPLRGNFIFRQELKSYTPECNSKCGIICNSFLVLIFLSIGLPIVFLSHKIKEYEIDYTYW